MPLHRSYGDYSGPVTQGTAVYSPVHIVGHLERAFYITSMVECCAKFGSIVGYDGTGVTAGLHQAILVYPKELADDDFQPKDDQGSLVELLSLIQATKYFPEKDELFAEFAKNSWELKNGAFYYTKQKMVKVKGRDINCRPGTLVYGADLRDTVTPIGGKVPSSGPQWVQACDWQQLFHTVFSNSKTFDVQIKFGMDHNKKAVQNRKLENGQSIASFIYGNLDVSNMFHDCTELDMAMTMWASHGVNAPAIAFKFLNQAITKTKFPGYSSATGIQKNALGKELIRLMGTSTYGRWNESEKNGRYQRTRQVMKSSGFWAAANFNPGACMAPDLPG